MIEGSRDPAKALDEADRLLELLPSVAHIVHMPSHIYIRTGHYQKGISSNKKAIAGYKNFKAVLGNWQGQKGLYYTHNADMQGANASLMGNYQEARNAYLQNMSLSPGKENDIQAQAGYLPFHGAQLYLLDVRFGKWKKVLQVQEPEGKNGYQYILWQFGQGMAKAKNGDLAGAKKLLNLLNERLSDPSLLQRYGNGNRNRSLDGAAISAKLLAGTIQQVQKNWRGAIALFKEAIVLEDQLFYSEPEDWRIPSRHLLAQAYLDKGGVKLAEKTLREDLLDHP